MEHIPVLLNEVIRLLDPKPGENFIDCTYGFGGHTSEILKKNAPNGLVLGIEWDQEVLERPSLDKTGSRLTLALGNFADIDEIVKQQKFGPINGILFDLGMSSWDIEKSLKGFSFLKDEPLDMRYNGANPLTAADIVNVWSLEALNDLFLKYGQERFAQKIAKRIVTARASASITTTRQLVEIIRRAIPSWQARQRMHFATKVFQSLRIVVNNELENLNSALPKAFDLLVGEGRLAVISFHSLEDKIAKLFFKGKVKEKKAWLLTKKPATASKKEQSENPRSRSAKLRVLLKKSW